MQRTVEDYFAVAGKLPLDTAVTDSGGTAIALGEGFNSFLETVVSAHDNGNSMHFIGNGGSAGIASHMAVDFAKRGGIRTSTFNDAAMLTCLGNDLGYDQVFAHQIGMRARAGDVLVAISSSGRSPNILNGCETARGNGAAVLTFSGFTADNPLRQQGALNFYVPSREYGFVELTHMALLGAMVDIHIGWPTDPDLRAVR